MVKLLIIPAPVAKVYKVFVYSLASILSCTVLRELRKMDDYEKRMAEMGLVPNPLLKEAQHFLLGCWDAENNVNPYSRLDRMEDVHFGARIAFSCRYMQGYSMGLKLRAKAIDKFDFSKMRE
ncbi:MAG: hypothetical protein HY514_02385 [Candidatus Aenigmarchaeota archaeon]|nr:hypothetical protein [Candidatus Aenigmarchaeota archaeon]